MYPYSIVIEPERVDYVVPEARRRLTIQMDDGSTILVQMYTDADYQGLMHDLEPGKTS